jgi:hypothetical protein
VFRRTYLQYEIQGEKTPILASFFSVDREVLKKNVREFIRPPIEVVRRLGYASSVSSVTDLIPSGKKIPPNARSAMAFLKDRCRLSSSWIKPFQISLALVCCASSKPRGEQDRPYFGSTG